MFTVILFVILIGYILSLSGRVSDLEKKLNSQNIMPHQDTVSGAESTADSQQNVPAPPVPTPQDFRNRAFQALEGNVPVAVARDHVAGDLNTQASGPDMLERFYEWVKEDFLVKLGALLLLIAFGWFVSYAFANNWIGPVGRITLGLLAGLSFLAFGQMRIRAYKHQGGTFMLLGLTVILATLFAAREIYDFFTPGSALLLMFISTAFVAVTSVRYDSKALAGLTLFAGAVAPLLTASPEPSPNGLFAYLLVVVAGTLWVVYITGWRMLSPIALFIVGFYTLPQATGYFENSLILLHAFVFTGIFFTANVVSLLRHKAHTITPPHLVTALGTALYLAFFIIVEAASEWQSMLFVVWALVFSVGAYIVFNTTDRHEPFYIYGAAALGFIAAATAVELQGASLIIAYIFEIIGLIGAGYALLKNTDVVRRLSYLFLGPIILSSQYFSTYSWDRAIGEEFFVLAILTITLFILALFFRVSSETNDGEASKTTATFFGSIGIGYLLVVIWNVLHVGMPVYDSATTIALVIYTIIGILTIVYGKAHNIPGYKIVGGSLIGLVVARLLLIDVWTMSLGGRIITFFTVGVLLIATAFIRKQQKKDEIEN